MKIIVIKATAKNLNDRYKNASEMLEDLQTCLSRSDEEKLVFNHDGESDPTIVANPRQIFDNSEEETKQEVVEERSTRKPKKAPAPKKKLDPKIIAGIVAGVVVVLGLIFYFVFLSPGKTDASVMPDLVGMSQKEAKTLLEDYGVTINEDMVYKELSVLIKRSYYQNRS